MITPVELSLLIQSTIYFTVVSEVDDFKWECKASTFFAEACQQIVFDASYNISNEYLYCKANTIKPFLTLQNEGSCGSLKMDVTVDDAAGCDSSCFIGKVTGEKDQCICGEIVPGTNQFYPTYFDTDECQKNFAYLMLALLIVMVLWLFRVLVQGTWNYLRFYNRVGVEISNRQHVDVEKLKDQWELFETPWNTPGKIGFGIFDILQAIALAIIMILLASTPFKFCEQPKLYTTIALAAISLMGVFATLPFMCVLQCIHKRIEESNPVQFEMTTLPETDAQQNP